MLLLETLHRRYIINPSTPELNPSDQRCLPGFFTGDFQFYFLVLEKSISRRPFFKFNEIKFCTLLMNCLSREKLFTYFYNKFRPVNRMHYTKCGVNSSLHNSGCCRRPVVPWITVLSRHTVFTFGVIYKFTVVWYSAKQGTTYSHTLHLAHLYIVPFLWPREHRRQRIWVDYFAGHCLLLRLSRCKTFFLFRVWYQLSEFHWLLPPRVWFFPPAIATDTYNIPLTA